MIFTHCKCVLACSVGKFGFSPQIASTFFFSSILCLLAYLLTFFRNPCGPCALSDSIRQSSSFRVIRFLFELPQAVKKHVIKFSLCPYIVVNQQLVTVCTVVQDCCKGRSNKYRKWHFWGSCRPETPQPINLKFGMDDYVRDTTRHPKWHVSRIRGVTPTNG